ncbi:ATP-binding protein [Actinoplanes awajinensis]|uniref:Histidine kinase/HSP90-like ATPase domain-containing protein n=1 Tax=Actinoplanes awajinensis subsp. mycoplanecinus TaxID=135947 RepID=A0A101JB62_9ACTN|nr:ATP-binding protein [Actinoplanes awajinensis]KUL23555.1 hypothetical protein ADL15_46160 [Actinoplanes awajinensis subsp. mycoplanecinus]
MQHQVVAVGDRESAIIEVTVTGQWSRSLWLQARDMLRRSLSAYPAGLLLDLMRLTDHSAGSAPLWLHAGLQTTHLEPSIPIATCLPAGSALAARLERKGRHYGLGVHADREQARTALSSRRPPTDQVHLQLAPDPTAAAVAREVIRTACEEWGITASLSRARLVVSELVGNAIEHAGTLIDLVVTRLGPRQRGLVRGPRGLRVAVYDRDPRLPHLLTPDMSYLELGQERGYGLRIIDAAARRWGALPTPTGKVVWAVLFDE